MRAKGAERRRIVHIDVEDDIRRRQCFDLLDLVTILGAEPEGSAKWRPRKLRPATKCPRSPGTGYASSTTTRSRPSRARSAKQQHSVVAPSPTAAEAAPAAAPSSAGPGT